MRRRGWRSLLVATRDAIRSLEQSTGNEGVDGVINRNLLLAYFFGVGRALDDAHFYLVRSRAPWHGRGVTVREWEALTWTIPAVQLADAPLARELLLRACELHGYAPGSGVRYFDGTLFEPGFCIEGAASYALATDRYIRETGDDQIVEEPILADALYASSEDIGARRNGEVPLYSTEVTPSGQPAVFPYTLHGNAVVAQALDVFRRTLDEETAREVQEPEAVRAALQATVHHGARRQAAVPVGHQPRWRGGRRRRSARLGPLASAVRHGGSQRFCLSTHGAVARPGAEVPRAAVRAVDGSRREGSAPVATPRAAPPGPRGRRSRCDGSRDGRMARMRRLGGLLAYSVWYAVHALGVAP